jgi:hypothetical protein
MEAGFTFMYPDWRIAAEDLWRQWKTNRAAGRRASKLLNSRFGPGHPDALSSNDVPETMR